MRTMRFLIFVLLITASNLPLLASDYYAAPTGLDTNPGSKDSPFFSIEKCQSVLTDGDVCYLRGGGYALSAAPVAVTGRKTIASYPGERVQLNLADGSQLLFVGSVATWDAPPLSLQQMLAVPDELPPSTIYVELLVSGRVVGRVFGASLPQTLKYVLTIPSPPKATTAQRTIQVKVYQQ